MAPLKTAFLGPQGTFTEEALLSQGDLAGGEHVPMGDVGEIVAAVSAGSVDAGVVPIENSIEGSVNATLDSLAFDNSDVRIRREIVLTVDLNLLVPAGHGALKAVISHPHAIAQCRRQIAEILGDVELMAATSTADAARQVAEAGAEAGVAAVGTLLAAELYGLEVAAENVQDHPDNATRFVVIGKGIPAPTGHDKTSIVCFQSQDRPGSLLAILQEFAARSINLTKIESRPTKKALGDYCFFMDFEGHVADELVADALRNLKVKLADINFLGSYPSAAGTPEEIRAERGAAFEAADEFIAELRAQIQ